MKSCLQKKKNDIEMYSAHNGGSIMDDSAIICDEVKEPYDEEIKTIQTNFNEKKATCNTQNFYILFAFLLIAT